MPLGLVRTFNQEVTLNHIERIPDLKDITLGREIPTSDREIHNLHR